MATRITPDTPQTRQHPPDVPALLKRHFGHEDFRPLQRQIIDDALANRDVFVVMPTGGGKSLCYQFPAVAQGGLTLVISPLIALMSNQVSLLHENGIAATLLNSTVDAQEVSRREQAIIRGEYQLLYMAPERLMSGAGRRLLERLPHGLVTRIAIDEAHCISEWGHDFRPEYRQLGTLRQSFGGRFADTPLMALTATATHRVADDIVSQLGLRDPATYRAGFERDNLFYEVRPKQKVTDEIIHYIREHPKDDGIIYCGSRAKTESLAETLRAGGIAAVAYHAGMEHADRARNQEAFINGDARVCCATIAFGMGVDKPDVRFVIHADLPRHLEGYYQETGRAGRDGLPARCILYFSPGDYARIMRFIDEKESEHERMLATRQLDDVMRFARTPGCRMVPLLAYFGEQHPGGCNHCDHCVNPPPIVDATQDARKLLSAVARTGQRFGIHHVIDVLRGSRSQRVRQYEHDQLSVHGIGRDQSKTYWLTLADHLLSQGWLAVTSDSFRTAHLTPDSKPLLKGSVVVEMALPSVSKRRDAVRTAADDTGDYDTELFDKLRTLRRRLAQEQNVPPYIVFGDAALRDMARRQPTTLEAFAGVSGVGRAKLEHYGETFIDAIRQHTGH